MSSSPQRMRRALSNQGPFGFQDYDYEGHHVHGENDVAGTSGMGHRDVTRYDRLVESKPLSRGLRVTARQPVSPAYVADLRSLVGDAFSDPRPLLREGVPGGAISERARSLAALRTASFVLPPSEQADRETDASLV